jgi:hypothetical protein
MNSQSTVNVQPHPPTAVNIPAARGNSYISEHETSWRSKFPTRIVLILSIIQMVFIVLIFILEIASLAVNISNLGGYYTPTGVGIWCGVPFSTASILALIFGKYSIL